MRKLNELYPNIDSDVWIRNIQYKVEDVCSGDLFLCLDISNVGRYSKVDEAIKRGAMAVVVQGDVGSRNIPVINVSNVARELPFLCEKFYNNPEKKLKMIGITGTEGKSSAGMIIQSLIGIDSCGYIGNDFRKCSMFRERTQKFDCRSLYNYLDEFVKFNCTHAVIESSSVALVNGVLEAVNYDAAIYTNISSDHLDEHGSFDNYIAAKMRLFEKVKDDGIRVLNKDDIYFETISKVCRNNYVTYGRDNDCTLQIVEYKCMYNKTSIKFKYKGNEFNVFSPLLGDFNVSNLAAALLVCLEMGFELDYLIKRLEKVSIDEHMMFLKTNDIYKVVVDYAHTPNSIFRLVSFIKSLGYSRVIVVIGQEGNRSVFRRVHVGEVVVKNCDHVIFTSDNPGSEDPNKIIDEMIANVKNEKNYEIIIERSLAIKKAIDMADENDIVLILGRGNDSEVAYSAIADRHIRESTTV